MDFKILIKKLNNTLSKNEEGIFDEWYNESAEHKRYFDSVKENYSKDIEIVDIQKGWKSISGKIELKPKKTNYWKYAVAASVVLLFSISFLFKYSNNNPKSEQQIVNATVEPGKDKATLTLENGTEIALQKGAVYQSETSVSNGEQITYQSNNKNTNEIKYNYLTIPRGGQFFIKLADGTQVWLNSESKLKYPVSFSNNEVRKVELVYGEAYFDVSPSEANNGTRFKVLTKGQEIEVLGTEFNVKAYEDETHIYTTLVEGKVALQVSEHNEGLLPNQQAVVNKNNSNVLITTVETKYEIAWKNGLFSFKNKTLKEIMKVLSRWYDVNVVLEDEATENIMFNGQLSKHQNIENILNLIKNTNFINAYDIDGKTITIKK
ncbi:FecR family protein [Tamlana crocina]